MKLKWKISLVALLPLLGFAVQSVRIYRIASSEHDVAEAMIQNLTGLDSISRAVQDLQKERGASSLFASGGMDAPKLATFRSATDGSLRGLSLALDGMNLSPARIAQLRKALDTVSELRRTTDSRSDPAQIRKGYTALVGRLLASYNDVITGPTSKGIGKIVTGLSLLEQAKESTGRLRALLSSVVAKDSAMDQDKLRQMIELHAAITEDLRSPALVVEGRAKESFARLDGSEAGREVEAVYQAVLGRWSRGKFGIDGGKCFDIHTRRIDQIDTVVQEQFADVGVRLRAIHDASQREESLSLWTGVLASVLLLSLVVWMVSDLRRRLDILTSTTRKVAKGDLTSVRTTGATDEIGALMDSMSGMAETLNDLMSELGRMSELHDQGEIEAVIDSGRFEGAYRQMGEGVNRMVLGHVAMTEKAMACVAEFGKGNFEAPLEKFPGKKAFINENIEGLRANLRSISGQVVELIEASKTGKLDTRGEAERFTGDWQTIVAGINEMLDSILMPINEAAGVLDKVAARDLTARVTGDYQGDHAKIKDALNLAVDNLEKALSQVADSTGQVSSASQQIASGSQNLAQGANEQASSLEEVSASLEEMASMTRQNADNALAAKNLAGDADGDTRQGLAAMNRMSGAIGKIKESSDQTAKIVKTIDEIAMQTNLLALNAAVEAARAGEAGRGFAVVAEEVRNLAQRSAQAAKNTADMIAESVRNADDGVGIVTSVAQSLDKIAGGVKKVNDLIGEIAAASKEQSQGIKEVTEAVAQMDKVTQQNAANAEESASASEELSSQAEELQSMVAQFRIRGTGQVIAAGQPLAGRRPAAIGMESGRALLCLEGSDG